MPLAHHQGHHCFPCRLACPRGIQKAHGYRSSVSLGGRAVTITCATLPAAAQVLDVLFRANLRLGRDFRIAPLDGGTPTRITVLVDLPAVVLRQLRAIPDTTIV